MCVIGERRPITRKPEIFTAKAAKPLSSKRSKMLSVTHEPETISEIGSSTTPVTAEKIIDAGISLCMRGRAGPLKRKGRN
jgi:hypothetical protein